MRLEKKKDLQHERGIRTRICCQIQGCGVNICKGLGHGVFL
jgi:hypothetical protein